MSTLLGQLQASKSRLANKLGLRPRSVRIGTSSRAVPDVNPLLIDMTANEVSAIAGVQVGVSQGPAYGYKCTINLVDFLNAIARGAADTGDTTFYQYSTEPGSCLGNVPTTDNPGQGAQWFVTEEDGVERPFWVNWVDVKRRANHVVVPLIGALAERLQNATLTLEIPGNFSDSDRGTPQAPTTPTFYTAYLQALTPSPYDLASGQSFEQVEVEGRLIAPATLGFVPMPGQVADCVLNGIPGELQLKPTVAPYPWVPVPNLGQRIAGTFVAHYTVGDAI